MADYTEKQKKLFFDLITEPVKGVFSWLTAMLVIEDGVEVDYYEEKSKKIKKTKFDFDYNPKLNKVISLGNKGDGI